MNIEEEEENNCLTFYHLVTLTLKYIWWNGRETVRLMCMSVNFAFSLFFWRLNLRELPCVKTKSLQSISIKDRKTNIYMYGSILRNPRCYFSYTNIDLVSLKLMKLCLLTETHISIYHNSIKGKSKQDHFLKKKIIANTILYASKSFSLFHILFYNTVNQMVSV